MRVTPAVTLGEIGDAGELRGREYPVRHTQPAHIGILIRRDVKQAEETPAEIVGRLRVFTFGGVLLEPAVGVEGILVALELFLVGKLAARRNEPVLGF